MTISRKDERFGAGSHLIGIKKSMLKSELLPDLGFPESFVDRRQSSLKEIAARVEICGVTNVHISQPESL